MSLEISNPQELEQKKQTIKEQGIGKIHILADFDRTMTKGTVNGIKTPSVISILRSGNYISEDYSKEAHKLADKYYPIEIDPIIPLEDKKEKMMEWWKAHFDLLIKSGLNKKHLKAIVEEDKIQFREGVTEFIDFLNEKNIPLVIISAGAVGDTIQMFLEKENKTLDNVHIITNTYEWDENGTARKVKEPIIHVANKEETEVDIKEIKNRKNVILLGDSIGDTKMIEGFDYNILIKIGFLDEKIEESLEQYKENFDVVITNGGDFELVNKLMREIIA